MIKRNKWKLIISSAVILLPMLIGLMLGKFMPEKIAVHWGFNGDPDGFASPAVAFLVIPLILLAVHWLCMILSAVIDKDGGQNKKITEITFWIIPAISLASNGTVLAVALGYTSKISVIIYVLLAVAFIFIGNYLPKTTRNRTMGIKIRWAMSNDENWQATHRFSGKLFVAAGFVSLLAIPLPAVAFPFVAIGLILLIAILPTVYSYRFYKKQIAEGRATKEDYEKERVKMLKGGKVAVVISAIVVPVLIVFLVITMFTGNIEVELGDTSMTVDASFSGAVTFNYGDIDEVEYREEGVEGERIMGFGSARLLIGTFQNEEFGAYTRYTYTGDRPCVVLTLDGKKVVIGGTDADSVKQIYDVISEKTEQ